MTKKLSKENEIVTPGSHPNDRVIVLSEKVDRQKLAYIIEHAVELKLDKSYVSGRLVGGNAQITLLSEYYSRIDANGRVSTAYHQRNHSGRYWTTSKYGLQNMNVLVRHTISGEYLRDLDIDNAHPTFLVHYCQTNGIECGAVTEYIQNREFHLAEYMAAKGCDRYSAKVAFLEITNGMIRYDVEDMSPGFIAYYQNIRAILAEVVDTRQDLVDISVANKTLHGKELKNIGGSVINLIMTGMENECLMVVYDVLKSHGIEVAALVFDGLMIVKDEHSDIPAILAECSETIKNVLGITLKMSEKPMDFSYEMNLEGFVPNIKFKSAKHKAVDELFQLTESEFVTTEQVSGNQYVGDLTFPRGVKHLAIVSSLGSGKTTSICKYIRDNGIKRVCILSPRQSFASAITAEYNEKVPTVPDPRFAVHDRFECYLDVKRKKRPMTSYNRLVISMESLYLLRDAKPFDLVVVDECQANLVAHTCAATNGRNIESNIETFGHLLETCGNSIWADAFLNNKTLNFLHHNRLRTLLRVFDTPMVSRTATEVVGTDLDSLLVVLIESLEKGERNYVFCASKDRAKRWGANLRVRFPEKKVLVYTAGEGGSIKNVNETWGDAEVVIVTSTVTVGINFDRPDWFHNVFISASAKTCNLVSDIFQSHYRVRHLINNRLFFHLATAVNKILSTNYKHLEDTQDWRETELGRESSMFTLAPLAIKQLAIDNEFEGNVSVSCLRPLFYRYLEACDYLVGEQRITELVEAFDVKPDETDLSFGAIKLLNMVEVHDLQTKRNSGLSPLTAEEKAQIQKYIFTNCFANKGFLYVDPIHVAKMWDAWIDYGKGRILAIKNEKKVLNGSVSMDTLFEGQADICSMSALQHSRNVKLKWILDLCRNLGLRNSQDIETKIPVSVLRTCIERIEPEVNDLRNAFDLRDQRKNKKKPLEQNDYLALLNSVFKSHGFTKLNISGPDRVKVKGKRIPNPNMTYALVSDSKHDLGTNTPKVGQLVFENVEDA